MPVRDADGREYLDATGGLWLAQVGHGRREIAEAAAEQMQRLEYFTSFWEFSNDRAIELAERLTSISPPKQTHVYYTSGGSEGNEAALKMSRYAHWRRGERDRTWILARDQAYHGVGYGSGTATGFPVYHEGFGPMLPHVHHLTQPWPYRAELFDGEDVTDFCIAELERTIEELGADKVAAFIGEPGWASPGCWCRRTTTGRAWRSSCASTGSFLIFDEVVSAYGRSGTGSPPSISGSSPTSSSPPKGSPLATRRSARCWSATRSPRR